MALWLRILGRPHAYTGQGLGLRVVSFIHRKPSVSLKDFGSSLKESCAPLGQSVPPWREERTVKTQTIWTLARPVFSLLSFSSRSWKSPMHQHYIPAIKGQRFFMLFFSKSVWVPFLAWCMLAFLPGFWTRMNWGLPRLVAESVLAQRLSYSVFWSLFQESGSKVFGP